MRADTWGIRAGQPVRSVDGARVGRVLATGDGRFEVERGFFLPRDYVVPYVLVARVDEEGVTLRLTRAELEDEWRRLDRFGRAAQGLEPAGGRFVGLHAPGDLGDGPEEADFPEDSRDDEPGRARHLVVHPDGSAELVTRPRADPSPAPAGQD